MATRLIPAYQTFHTKNGVSPLSGGLIHFFVSESVDTDKDTFSDDTLLTANTNPLVLDSAGRVQVDVWGDGLYKMVVADSSDVTIDTFDPIAGGASVSTLDDISDLTALLKASLTDGTEQDVSGYFVQGDGGGGRFFFDSASTATVDGGLIIATDEGGTGRWIRIIDDVVTQIMFGVTGDGSTDDAATMQFFFDSAKSLHLHSNTYALESVVSLPNGATLHADEGAVLDFSGATVLGNFPNANALEIGSGSFTSISDLSVNAVRGDFGLTFASDPVTTQGDILVAWNSTVGSFNGADNAYHAGEYFQVAIDGGTTQTVNGPIFDSYITTAVDMFKLNGGAVNITGALKVIGPDAAGLDTVRTVRAEFLIDCNIDINAESKSRVALSFKNCFNVSGNWRGVQVRDNSLDDYGLVISNCQHMRSTGYWYGEKHGVTTGGNSENGAVPNRDIQLKGFFAGSVSSASAILWHGNTEFCSAEGTFQGAITTAGDNMRFRGTIYAKNNGVCIQGSELLGLNHDFDGVMCVSEGDPNTASRGVIDFGGNTSAIDANTTRGGKLRLTNMSIKAPQANGVLQKIVNRGATFTERSVIDFSGTSITEDSGALSAGMIIQNVSGDDFDVVNLYGYDNGVNDPGYSTMNVTAIRGWGDSGTVDILTTTGASSVVDTITFNKEAPIAPSVGLILDDVSVSGDKLVTEISARTTTTATVGTLTIDGTNFGANVTLTGIYTAVIDQ